MKCPKCDLDITEEMLVCPNCKKVLKLVCPKCNTVNKTNTCKKCGFTIISKCHQCGKINQTVSEKCSKCGFSTYTSVAINSSLIDEFACLTLEFPNIDDIKPALGSTKLEKKFRQNLDQLINNYASGIDLTREVINDVYIIRFNKDDSFYKSANSAIKAAIAISNLITELNFKLEKAKNITLYCKMAILKRDVYSKPEDYKSGFDIKLIYQDKSSSKLLKNLQVIADSYIYEQVDENYDLRSLSANLVKNEMIMFFELNLKKYIKIPVEKKEEKAPKDALKLNIFEEEVLEEDIKSNIYDVDAIDFNELKCKFTHSKSVNLINEVLEQFKQNPKKIVSVKAEKELLPKTGNVFKKIQGADLFNNIIIVTCYDDMKYKPYGFFSELISCMYNFPRSPKGFDKNQFDMFNEIDPSGFIKDLINLKTRTFPHPEDVRYSLFDIFFEIFQSMSKTLIYIENFEKIDDTSQEVLRLLLDKFEDFDVSYLIMTDNSCPLHKNAHFLLANPSYVELVSTPTPFKEFIEVDIALYENILESFYLKKISQNTKGSVLYFNNALQSLIEKQLLDLQDGVLELVNFENILIPTTLDELLARRLRFLSEDAEMAYVFLVELLLIGPSVDSYTAELLGLTFSDESPILKVLLEKGYISIIGNRIYVQNYNMYRDIFLSYEEDEFKQAIAKYIFDKLFIPTVSHPGEILFHRILKQEKQEFLLLENLSHLNASLGDFSAYLNCSVRFLKLLDNHVNEGSDKSIEDYKMDVYENISNLLYKYTPNEIYNIAQVILNNLEKSTNDKKIIELCNKMLQGCLIGGNYSHALELIHKILSRFSNFSTNPADANFSIAYFLISLIKIEVLFSIGNFKDCSTAAEEILEVISKENFPKLKPEHFSQKQFEEVIVESMCFGIISKVILLQSEADLKKFIEKVQSKIDLKPEIFNLLLKLEKVIKKMDVKLPVDYVVDDNKFSKIISSIIRAFTEEENNYKKFADYIYQAKLSAKMNNLTQIELFCDLLIGFAYFNLDQLQKSSAIYHSVLEVSTKNGLKMITYLAWYFISVLKLKQQETDMAFGITNNVVVQLEKDSNAGDFLFFLFRVLLSQILIAKNETDSAQLCLNNAKFIKEKYSLNYNIELDFTSKDESQ